MSHPGEIETSTDFAERPVPQEFKKGFVSLLSVWVNFQLSTVMLFFGGVTLAHLPLRMAIIVVASATIIIATVSLFTGYLGAKTGLSTTLLCEKIFGVRAGLGQQIFQVLIELGWFTVIVGLTGDAGAALLGITDSYGHALVTLGMGALYVLSVCFGFRGLRILSIIAVPIVLVLLSIICIRYFSHSVGPLWRPTSQGPNLFQSISIATGTFITGAALSADLARFAKTPSIGGSAGSLGFLITIPLQLLLGAMVAMTSSGDPDFIRAVGASGLGSLVFLFLIAANCIGDATLYLAIVPLAKLTRLSQMKLVITLGIIGSCLAAFGVSRFIISWLEALSILLPPLAGPLIWTALCLFRGIQLQNILSGTKIGFSAWLGGVIAGAAMEFAGVGLAPVAGIVVSLFIFALGSTMSIRETSPEPSV